MWNQNENMLDRSIRGVIGIGLLTGAVLGLAGIWQWVVGLIGVILLVTGVTGVCPGAGHQHGRRRQRTRTLAGLNRHEDRQRRWTNG